jgi:crossover junction endodeoxyribonuclease RusA
VRDEATIEFFVRGDPQPKGSFRVVTRTRRGRRLHVPRVLKDSARTYTWERTLAECARVAMHGGPPLVGPVRVDLVFYLRRPGSHLTRQGALRVGSPELPQVKPDIDKLARSACDALSGIVFVDDKAIVSATLVKVYARAADPPGVRVRVQPVTSLPAMLWAWGEETNDGVH